jgi:pimeloyl-ACP methyl ester carboxylesterase
MLYTFQSGSPANPAIVFLHGGGLSSRMWQPVIDRLPGYYCLALDLPAHGYSCQLAPFNLDEAARGVVESIRQRVPEKRAHLVGLSLGGAVAFNTVRLCPDVADSIMVTGTTSGLGSFLGRLTLSSLWMLRGFNSESLVKASARQWGIPDQYASLFHDDLIHATSENFNRTLINCLMEQKLPQKMNSPLLVTVGEKETVPAKQAARQLSQLFPSALVRKVKGMGHVWALQNPDLFASTVASWINGAPLPLALTVM